MPPFTITYGPETSKPGGVGGLANGTANKAQGAAFTITRLIAPVPQPAERYNCLVMVEGHNKRDEGQRQFVGREEAAI